MRRGTGWTTQPLPRGVGVNRFSINGSVLLQTPQKTLEKKTTEGSKLSWDREDGSRTSVHAPRG